MRLVLVILTTAALSAVAPAAAADPVAVSQAAQALHGRPGVYVAPGAAGRPLSGSDVDQLRSAVSSASTPVFVAALGESTRAEADTDVHRLAQTVHRQGTYVVVAAGGFVASSDVPGVTGNTAALVSQAINENDGRPAAELVDFVQLVDGAAASGDGSASNGTTDTSGGSGSSWLPIVVVLAIVAALFALVMRRRRSDARGDAAALRQVSAVAEQDITALGEQLRALSIPPSGADAATADYQAALDAYDRAKRELAAARRPGDVARVTSALEEGRWRLACVQARLAGQPLPERRPPCFFNPQHGPSTADAEWSPPGGAPRVVPVCAADADRLARGVDADSRMVPSGRGMVPYWQGPAYYGPYAGGFFGGWGGGSFVGGLLAGELLTGGLGFGGTGYGGWGGYGAGYDAGYDAGQDSGDFTGGFDIGGGDFGGGFDGGGGGFDGGGGGFDGGGW